MASDNDSQPEHTEAAWAATARILTRRGWSLVAEAEMVAQVVRLLAEGAFTDAGLAILRVYSQALYYACSGAEGVERQETAYQELSCYLHDVSWRMASDLAPDEREELVNQTLAELFYRLAGQGAARKLSAVREPGAFLAVAIQQLRNVARRWRRDNVIFGDTLVDGWEFTAEADERPEYLTENHELRRRVKQCFLNSLRRHPRARVQLWVVWLRTVLGVDYETIGARYGLSVENIRILHSRGLKNLRTDPAWNELACESGLSTKTAYSDSYSLTWEQKGVS